MLKENKKIINIRGCGERMSKKEIVQLILLIGMVAFIYYVTGMGCPILYVTGIPCLGCGMTRACISLLKLNFAAAFHYHPLCYFLPVCVLVLVMQWKMGKKKFNWCIAGIITVFTVVYLIRLFNPADTIVKINFKEGLIYKIYHIARRICERRSI